MTGLEVGTLVRVAGLPAGEVLSITLPSRPSDRFHVRMRLREDVRQLVRVDSTSTVQTDGILGSAFIQISVGTDASPPVESGDTIVGIDPIEFWLSLPSSRNLTTAARPRSASTTSATAGNFVEAVKDARVTSVIGQWLRLSPARAKELAATFIPPIAAVMFALAEIIGAAMSSVFMIFSRSRRTIRFSCH